jgi:Zn finger protein HypA/HybF involved in hydrogenase expression
MATLRSILALALFAGFVIVVVVFVVGRLGRPSGVQSMRMLIHNRRRRKVQCLHCGYSRRGLNAKAVCPECGVAADGVVTGASDESDRSP